jgi:hypothetical protein
MVKKNETDILAATILFDGTLTLATLLRITFDPVCSLAVIVALLEPHLRNSTQYRPMIAIDIATKAKLVLRVRPT